MAKGLPLENPEGGLQYSSEVVHWVLKGPPEGSIHHDTSEAFPQIFFLFTNRTFILRETWKNKQTNYFPMEPWLMLVAAVTNIDSVKSNLLVR